MRKNLLVLGIGLLFLLLSLRQVIFFGHSHFYTEFTLGSWLILDTVDCMVSGTSILSYFLKNKKAFGVFFIIVSVFFFLIDFFIGVRILQMWKWLDYSFGDYLQMFAVMNPAFVLSMYELNRLAKHLTKRIVIDESQQQEPAKALYILLLFTGIVFLLAPIGFLFFHMNWLLGYSLFLTFSSMIFICDAVVFLAKGIPVLHDILFLKKPTIIALIVTVYTALLFTEGVNLFGHEWVYTRMPFIEWHILSVPLAVFIGWIPLVIGAVSVVTMIQTLFPEKE